MPLIIPGYEAVCSHCGTSSRNLDNCEFCRTLISNTAKIRKTGTRIFYVKTDLNLATLQFPDKEEPPPPELMPLNNITIMDEMAYDDQESKERKSIISITKPKTGLQRKGNHRLRNPYIRMVRDPAVEALLSSSIPPRKVSTRTNGITKNIVVISSSDSESDYEIEVALKKRRLQKTPNRPTKAKTTTNLRLDPLLPLTASPKRKRYDFEKYVETEDDKNKVTLTKRRRLDYLLKKSEFHTCQLSSGDALVEAEQDTKRKQGKVGIGENRHRHSEKAEDAQLLQNAENESKGVIEGSGVHSAIVSFAETPPYIKNGEMRDYQLRGLNWLINLYENGINGILADEMGLGKTLQTISLLGYLKHIKSVGGHSLVIIPKSTLGNWENEFKRWCPTMETVSLWGDATARKYIINNSILRLNQWDVLLTTYDMVLREKGILKKISWNYLIIDEGQRIKNENTKLAVYVREFTSRHRLLLTGTPLQNNLHELWALLNFLLPEVFDSSENFDDWFNTESCLGDDSLLTRLHSILRPFLLRRIKSDVEKRLLPKIEIKVYVPLTTMQRNWYKKILLKDLEILNTKDGTMRRVRLLNVLMQLRKCCNHPYLFAGAESGPPYDVGVHLASNSGKLLVLDKLLLKLKSEGSRVLIFCQMTRFMDILDDYFFWRKFEFHRLDGSTPHLERQKMIDEFNTPGSTSFIFMLSTRAGGLGINLASADVVIIYDSDWNPQVDIQAMDRAHRIGQTKQVRVFRLISENTVEEKIVERAAVKLKLDKLVIQQGRLTDSTLAPKKDDILNWIRYGANLILSSTGDQTIPDETIESILQRSKSKQDQLTTHLDSLGESNLRNFVMESTTSVYNFEGENYLGKAKEAGTPLEFIGLPKRERKRVNYANVTSDTKYKDGYDKDFVPQRKPPRDPKPQRERKRALRAPPPLPPLLPPNPKPPGYSPLPKHQFYPQELHDLFRKEVLFYQKTVGYKAPCRLVPASATEQSVRQMQIDTAEPLTLQERLLIHTLPDQGFPTWSRNDFLLFMRLVQKHGRTFSDISRFAGQMQNKTKQEVLAYGKVFLERYSELDASDRFLMLSQTQITSSSTLGDIIVARGLSARIAFCQSMNLELHIPYKFPEQSISNDFNREQDRYLISIWCKYGLENVGHDTWTHVMHQIVLNNGDKLRASLVKRTVEEIQDRCTFLWLLFKDVLVTPSEQNKVRRQMEQRWNIFSSSVKDGEVNNEDDTTSNKQDIDSNEDSDEEEEVPPARTNGNSQYRGRPVNSTPSDPSPIFNNLFKALLLNQRK